MRNLKTIILITVFGIALVLGACLNPARKPATSNLPKEETTISLYVNETGKTIEIKFEKYLEGVVGAEMETDWPLEALKAQAILARTFTLKKIQSGGVKRWGTDASSSVEEFQAYDPKRVTEKVRQAVAATRGKVLLYRGQPINGWFFADAGGITAATAVEGLGYHKEATPYIHSVKDPGSSISPPENRFWTAAFSRVEIAQAVKNVTGKDPGSNFSITVANKGPSGRVTSFRVGDITISGSGLRLALGSEKLKSSLITNMSTSADKIIFQGRGYGHGVGMSQWGARALANQGKKAEDILEYFFRDVNVVKLWK